ncbi:RNA-guided endonuclease InsQ/TnpB family protein [Nonomuraea aridisoli]|uniref:Transposase n=1 Tax=Nonomuraea aridisoli TaxID=2070368 RepID=A0A2W2EEM9_9ACTN|nr:RNA-guided endonuclease TnpB family protein [Nonomuraea aridisoli]PZG15435.1 transposase [Nonomuraea aridisoli]
MRSAFKMRAYPTPQQEAVLNRTFGCVRLVWNKVLAWRQARYRTEGVTTSYAESDRYLTALKHDPDLAFLSEVSSVALQQTVRHQYAAMTVSRDPCGRWYVSLAVEVADPEQAPPAGRAVGVDLGVTDFAVTSDGEKIANARHLVRRERRLARYQRRMARRQPGSNNRRKARAKVARAHRKVAASRADFLHKTSTRLVRDHDVIVIEDLNVTGMVRNRRLAKAISDASWGTFRSMLEYKAVRYGRRLIVIDRWCPSSKTCSACGHLLAVLPLGTRTWRCPSCRALHDRDVNAAKNILAAGLAVPACGDDVRQSGSSGVRSSMKQEPRPVRAGIPVLLAGSSQDSLIRGSR